MGPQERLINEMDKAHAHMRLAEEEYEGLLREYEELYGESAREVYEESKLISG